MESTTETNGSLGEGNISSHEDSEARDLGEYVDASKLYPAECWAQGIRARVVFSRDCWDNVVVSLVKAHGYWTESTRLRSVLSRFLESCPWPKVGEKVGFEICTRTPEGTSEETLVTVELSLWNGDRNEPFLLFRRVSQD